MTETLHTFHIIDSHTGGEPTRMVYDGFPELQGVSLREKLTDFRNRYDHLRRAVILEPRGHDVMVGALLCRPENPQAAAGVIFFNNEGYLGMCGHGSIGVLASLFYQQKITPGTHLLETPVGTVTAVLHEDGSVGITNVPSYRYRTKVALDVPEIGRVHGDIAWGGNWFFLVDDHGQRITADNVQRLTETALQIKRALEQNGICGEDGAAIDHIELFGGSETADSRSFVLCPGGAYDRSPCGTGTSAKLACLAADGKLQPQQKWRQESVIGSIFEADFVAAEGEDKPNAVIPTIKGRAHVCAESRLIIQADDPFAYGF
ncbi:4-hydroxyproline epimerase [Neisseria sp. ZJ106]|uniref:4-hydroxyproline epimerase n=1 Tax=Neisseria lisongii TaxID=2912188 RepID=A0ABY7RN95_9NEIS|nr:4-hydroxyproline epimerase [Neisseria lisongii]MCF7521228.1 4-hydroxyproline epimerase [Neisseria lisongii]WCL71720.1 4-hydroxyproline epimerase [Neisseria lisongii]